jgi:hypothetical protein
MIWTNATRSSTRSATSSSPPPRERTLQRSFVTRDSNDPDRFMILAFFDSYESAMEDSNLPETAAFAEKQMPLLDGPPTFYDLDVIEDRT